ncbi:MAG TPA: DUF308 domain-containing protein [Glaciihabitans sp.]|jgi:uncharacterized membrane protein HdeD (DUF308 family)|nr:DUF308 domain-containing protein [Glaciihabitans sp.]
MAKNSLATSEVELNKQVQRVFRRWQLIGAVTAIVVGVIGLVWPQSALRAITLLFGVYLIVVGVTRISSAFGGASSGGVWRWLQVAFGVIVLIAGVLCLNNPFGSAVALTFVIGIGWVLDGIATIVVTFTADATGSRWRSIAIGLVSIVAGGVLMVTPVGALSSFLLIASILLIIIGAVSLITLIADRSPG